ncbi:hypothetical protein Syun_025717 [Stephania yunnanensis]|uniref:BSD domain-containing protein n=1 Tax=Stephania yunnanensis TaxID=152371 RepID=A0AAP0EXJ1_9MAGN
MSWLSIPNPFKSFEENPTSVSSDDEEQPQRSPSGGAGVKEDLSELGKTIGRQLWGVASFLAPPPAGAPAPAPFEGSDSFSSQGFVGIRNDFAEIGGSFKSMVSTTRAVNKISRLASNLLQFDEADDDDDGDESVGVTKEVLEFARELSAHPECWINFPLSLDNFDFEMSDVQREHALTVGDLVPGLLDLKSKICSSHMNEGHFWIVYFILLLPRLNTHNLEILSTSQLLGSGSKRIVASEAAKQQ